MTTASVEKIAEAVLYEGYLLYPYTRTAMKNQQRWTFGGVYPQKYSEATGGHDPWLMQTQCLVLGSDATRLEVKIRFLQVVQRQVLQWDESSSEAGTPVDELWVDGEVYRPWEEAVERERAGTVSLHPDGLPLQLTIDVPAGRSDEPLVDAAGNEVGALVRTWEDIEGRIEIEVEPLRLSEDGMTRQETDSCYRLTVRIVNTTPWDRDSSVARGTVVRHAMISTHAILRVQGGEFISLLEPPESYRSAAATCENIKTWPVLVGDEGERHTVLSSPIILYDYPQISPESRGNYYDATEIDELLALSVMTLTDEEKQELRESDPRGREILERTESLSHQDLMNLHGAVRGLQAARRDE
jgi:hypothetical protein